ncbi:ribonuclease P protein subunit POP4 [Entomortierella parvispora]|uniref:Ribonuclease P protein subunit p29 n=1 Tax=Entomortierella parvispora TaxID=205924 RepID=A0A9P3LVF9_9FUNG|nr:ribonuclease P protein subunit POP4 [Entomortierella parvispora]
MDGSQDRADLSLYSRLSEDIHKTAGIEDNARSNLGDAAKRQQAQSFVPKYVGDAVVEGYDGGSVYGSKVKNKVFSLDNPPKESSAETKEKQKKRKRNNKSKALTAKEKRTLGVYDIPVNARKYTLFQPLHDLWKGYIDELYGSSSPTNFSQKLLKADFHGAIITVIRSKCPTYVGVSGIVAQETENVFKIITVNDALRVVPKVNSVFTVHIRNSIFTIHGNQFRYRASMRSTKKFKSRPTIDL